MNDAPFPPPVVVRPAPRRRNVGARVALALLVSMGVRGVTSALLGSGSAAPALPEVGSCFNGRSPERARVDCASPHDSEVFAQAQHPALQGDALPAAGDSSAEAVCLSAFHDTLGASLSSTDLTLTVFMPGADSWARGERTVTCALTRSEPRLVGTYRPDPSSSPVVPEKTVGALVLGDCLELQDLTEGRVMSAVPTPACNTNHNLEVFGVVRLDGPDYPADINAIAEKECLPYFEAYVGVDYRRSELNATSMSPSRYSWSTGDRRVLCLLGRADWSTLRESMKGSGI